MTHEDGGGGGRKEGRRECKERWTIEYMKYIVNCQVGIFTPSVSSYFYFPISLILPFSIYALPAHFKYFVKATIAFVVEFSFTNQGSLQFMRIFITRLNLSLFPFLFTGNMLSHPAVILENDESFKFFVPTIEERDVDVC